MFRLPKGAVRPFLAVSLFAALAACGGQQEGPATSARGHYSRPASYDPPGPPHDPWGPWIREASRRFDVPETWIREVMRQESGGRASATSRAGAMGLMQVMPGTFRELQARHGLGDDPYHPYDSIMAGTAYIREMYDLYGSPAFLAAYNAGPRRLEDYLWGGRGLPNETRNYVARIGPRVIDSSPSRRAPPEVYAAAEIPLNVPAGPRRMDQATMLALREQRERLDASVQMARATPPAPLAVETERSALAAAPPRAEPPMRVASADPRAAGTVIVSRMDPIPDGSTPEGAAALARSQQRQQLEEQQAAPPPQGFGMAGGSAIAGLPQPPAAPAATRPGSGVPSLLAAASAAPAPAPQRRGATGPATVSSRGSQLALAAPSPAASRRGGAAAAPQRNAAPGRIAPAAAPLQLALAPLPPSSRGFSLMPRAQASTLPTPPVAAAGGRGGTGNGGWGVQVGAFASENLARAAANQARDAVQSLGARTVVQPVAQGRSTLYRARLTGLSRDAANAACGRMRARGGCIVLSPDAI